MVELTESNSEISKLKLHSNEFSIVQQLSPFE